MEIKSNGLKVRSGLRAGKLAANHNASCLAAIALGTLVLGSGGCGAPDPGGEDSPTEMREQPLVAIKAATVSTTATLGTPTPSGDTPSTVTFFSEVGLWGDSLTRQVAPTT